MLKPNRPTRPISPEAIVVCSPEDPKDFRAIMTAAPKAMLLDSSDTEIGSPLVIANAGSYIGVSSMDQILTYLQLYPTISSIAVVVNNQDLMIDAIQQSLELGAPRPPYFRDAVQDIIESWRQHGASNGTLRGFSRDEIAVALSELMVVRLAHHLTSRGQKLASPNSEVQDINGELDLDRVLVGGFVSDNAFSRLKQTVPMTQAGVYSDKILQASTSRTR